jgi:hypothetical protein
MSILILVLLLGGKFGVPNIHEHHFEKRVLDSKQSVENENETNTSADISAKKIFGKLHVGLFTFKKRKVKGGRITFTCNGCQKFKHFLSVQAWVDRVDSDPENDQYTLDADTLPSHSEHACVSSGVEDLVTRFRTELELDATIPSPV